MSPSIKQRYAKPIPVVTPGMELTNIWFSGQMEGNGWVNSEPTPDRFTVTIEYDGPDGTRYKDPFPLDIDLIRKHTYVSSSTDPENQVKEIGKSLAQMEKSIARIAGTIEPREHDE